MKRIAALSLLALAGTLPAAAQFDITTIAVPNARIGQPYGAVAIETVNGTGPVTWSFAQNQAPPPGFVVGPSVGDSTIGVFCYGLLSSGGQPFCTGPVQGFLGTFTFTIRAVDLAGHIATRQYTIILQDQLTILTSELPDAAVNEPYFEQLIATGGTGLYRWTVIDGFLPPGIGLSLSGELSGTAPAIGGTYTFVVQVEDVLTGVLAVRQLFLNVGGGLRIVTTSLPLLTVSEEIMPFEFMATGGTNYVWSVVNSMLPDGLTLSPGGVLTGVVLATGTYQFQVRVEDTGQGLTAQRVFTLYVTRGPLRIIETQLPVAAAGTPYQTTLTPGGGLPPFTWTFSTLATQNLHIDPATGTISGIPPAVGTFQLPVALIDATNTRVVQQFTLHVVDQVSIGTSSFPNGTLGVPYFHQLQALGGQPPYRWTVVTGSLPPGLMLDGVLGRIQGTPTAEGAFTFTLRVTDFGQRTATRQLALVVGPGLTIVTTSLADAITNQGYSQALQTTGGAAPLMWSIVSGSLPAGMTLDASTGVISGTATVAGSSTFTVRVRDAAEKTAERQFTLTVAQPLVITTGTLPNGGLNSAYSQQISATGGRTPYSFRVVSGTLPPGLQLNTVTGVLSGTASSVGTYGFGVEVGDAGTQTARANYSITIGDPLTIITGDLSAPFEQAFSQTLQASGGFPPYVWSLAGGTLPPGLSFNAPNATISGTPAVSGSFSVTFQVRDQAQQTASKTITISVSLPPLPAVSFGGLPDTSGPAQQPAVALSIGSAFPAEITGKLTLTFTSSVGGSDDTVRFSNGSRMLNFTIPAGSTDAEFANLGNPVVLTGTVAGTIQITASFAASGGDITPHPAPSKSIAIDSGAPVISAVQLQRSGNTLNVIVTGYTTTREISSGVFRFSASGGSLSQSDFTVQLSSAFAAWFGNPGSNATGGLFRLTVPFSVTGDNQSVTLVSVTLTNARGTSASVGP